MKKRMVWISLMAMVISFLAHPETAEARKKPVMNRKTVTIYQLLFGFNAKNKVNVFCMVENFE